MAVGVGRELSSSWGVGIEEEEGSLEGGGGVADVIPARRRRGGARVGEVSSVRDGGREPGRLVGFSWFCLTRDSLGVVVEVRGEGRIGRRRCCRGLPWRSGVCTCTGILFLSREYRLGGGRFRDAIDDGDAPTGKLN